MSRARLVSGDTIYGPKVKAPPIHLKGERFCPDCGLVLKVRKGPHGDFLGCSGYPTCEYTHKAKGR